MIGLGLDYRLNFVELVALGTYNRAIVEPREVFYMAVHKNSKYVILAHNHPGGTLALPAREARSARRVVRGRRRRERLAEVAKGP